jgi:hypothetical protein
MIGLALVASVWAVEPSDEVTLGLAGGTTIDGKFLRAASDTSFNVMVDEEIVTVQVALLESVAVNGAPQPVALFRLEVSENWANRHLDLGPTPLPGVALGSSILFAGTGHALLKEGAQFRSYAVLEVVCMSLEAVAIFYAEDAALLITVGALDVGIRGLSGVSAYHEARSRRARARDR